MTELLYSSNETPSKSTLVSRARIERGRDKDIVTIPSVLEPVTVENAYDYSPLPPPYIHVKEDIRDAKPYQHGKIEISQQGELLRSYISFTKFTRDLVESYDYRVNEFINTVKNTKIRINHNDRDYLLSFSLEIHKPTLSIGTKKGTKYVPMTPLQARQQKLTYGADMFLKFRLTKEKDNDYLEELETNMGKLPVMIGSYLDNTSSKGNRELLDMGECPYDVSGYFPIKGMEYVILMSDKLRPDKFIVYPKEKYNVSTITSHTFDNRSSMIEVFRDPKTMIYRVWFGMLGSLDEQSKPEHSINIFEVFKMISDKLGIHDMIKLLRDTIGVSEKNYIRNMDTEIAATLADYQTLTDNDIWKIFSIHDSSIKKSDDKEVERATWRSKIKNNPKREYDKSIGIHEYRQKFMKLFFSGSVDADEYGKVMEVQSDRVILEKLYSFGIMINRLISVNVGSRLPDDRDSWANKEVKNAGVFIGEKLNSIWNGVIEKIKSTDYSKFSNLGINNIPTEKAKIGDTLEKSFTSNWNQGNSDQVKKITETLSRTSILASYAYVTRISSPGSINDKTKSKRSVQQSQWGYVCYVDSPEGQNVGLLKAKSVGCWVSISKNLDRFIYNNNTRSMYTFDEIKRKKEGKNTFFSYNGKILGFVNANEMVKYLNSKKDKKVIPFDAMILHAKGDNIVYLYSNSGRLVRPVLTVNKHENDIDDPYKQTINFYEAVRNGLLKKEQIQDFQNLVDLKLISYVDAWEQEDGALIAQSRNMLESITNDIQNTRSLLDKANELKGQHNLYISIHSKHIEGSIYKTPLYIEKDMYIAEINYKLDNLKKKKDTMVEDMTKSKSELNEWYRELKLYLEPENEKQRMADGLGISTDDIRTFISENMKIYNLVKDILDSKKLEYIATFKELNLNYKKRFDVFGEDLKSINKEIEETEKMSYKDPIVNEDIDKYIVLLQNSLRMLAKKQKFDYCEMDPNSVYGVSASIIPLPGNNQGPRNSFECNMGRQAVGVYNSNHMYRYDSAVQKLLAYPSIPSFKTQLYEPLGMDRLGSGESVILAMLTNMNLQEEDAVMVSQRAIDSGFGLMVYYSTISSSITKDRTRVTEEFTRTIPQKMIRAGDKDPYRHLDENGIVRVGSTLETGDCVIGKIRRLNDDGYEDIKDASSYAKKKEEGTVMSVIKDGSTIIVKIYGVYNQIVGNKGATRHAQKGTIGTVYSQDRMMKFADGSTPDIIMNTHAIPSRMTLGQLIEMLVGKSSLVSGQSVDATAYNDFNVDDFTRTLKSYGYNEWGWEVMINGLTGEKFKALVFSGPVFYQILKHQVKDKNQVRGRGAKSEMTGQPVAGKDRGGGLRFGYQEKDAILSHGATNFINEVFLESSDKRPCIVCKECNNLAYIDMNGIYQCRACTNTDPVMVNLPNSHLITSNLLAAAGVYHNVIPKNK